MSSNAGKKVSGFERLSNVIGTYSASTPALLTAAGLILLWAVTGPIFHYSNTWPLDVNTGTSIIQF